MNAGQIEKLKKNGKRSWGLDDKLMNKVIGRDKKCVYCRHKFGSTDCNKATWEHINNETIDREEWNIALCCKSCNSSKLAYESLRDWFKKAPRGKTIKIKRLASVIKKYIDKYEKTKAKI